MNKFSQTLKGVDRVMYNAAYKFHMDNCKGATENTAHNAGMEKLKSISKIKESHATPQTWIDLTTGKTHKAINR